MILTSIQLTSDESSLTDAIVDTTPAVSFFRLVFLRAERRNLGQQKFN